MTHSNEAARQDSQSRTAEYAQRVYDALGIARQVDAPDQALLAWYSRFTPDQISAQELQRWSELARNLRRASRRPPTVGVFGESQSGKSYLISRFSGGDKGLCVRDPEAHAGSVASNKPWATGSDPSSIDFLRHLNPDTAGEESTSVICRLTEHPVDQPVTADCFVAHVLSHADVLVAVASGYLFEFKQYDDARDIEDRLRGEFDAIRDAPEESGGDWMSSFARAWDYLQQRHESSARIRALTNLGIQDLIGDALRRGQRPAGTAWVRLVSMLWEDRAGVGLTRLYKKLLALLEQIEFAEILEIPTLEVARPTEQSRPLLDVELLNHLFNDDGIVTAKVYYRAEEDDSAKSTEMRRPELAALIAELVLPVTQTGVTNGLLDRADILDFPGARPGQSQYDDEQLEADAITNAALAAFRRGKLTRLFTSMLEKRELSILCLCAPAGTLDASDMIRNAVDDWLAVQSRYGVPPLALAITKADILVARGPADVSICQFGSVLDRVHRSYCVTGDERDWLKAWPPGATKSGPFRDVFWLHNHVEHPIDADETRLRKVRELYEDDELVRRHVDDHQAKWIALIEQTDVEYLTRHIVRLADESERSDRLLAELGELVEAIVGQLDELHYVDATDPDARAERRRQAKEQAREDVESIRDVCFARRANLLVRLLDWLSVEEQLIVEHLRILDRERSQTGGALATCDELLEKLRNVWQTTLRARLNETACGEFGLSIERVTSLRRHWTQFPAIPWVHESLHEAACPFFDPMPDRRAQQCAAAASIAAVWNRLVVDLGCDVRLTADPPLPPSLTVQDQPEWRRHWMWMLDHWDGQLPQMYADSVAPRGTEPEWNESLTPILASFRRIQEEIRG